MGRSVNDDAPADRPWLNFTAFDVGIHVDLKDLDRNRVEDSTGSSIRKEIHANEVTNVKLRDHWIAWIENTLDRTGHIFTTTFNSRNVVPGFAGTISHVVDGS